MEGTRACPRRTIDGTTGGNLVRVIFKEDGPSIDTGTDLSGNRELEDSASSLDQCQSGQLGIGIHTVFVLANALLPFLNENHTYISCTIASSFYTRTGVSSAIYRRPVIKSPSDESHGPTIEE